MSLRQCLYQFCLHFGRRMVSRNVFVSPINRFVLRPSISPPTHKCSACSPADYCCPFRLLWERLRDATYRAETASRVFTLYREITKRWAGLENTDPIFSRSQNKTKQKQTSKRVTLTTTRLEKVNLTSAAPTAETILLFNPLTSIKTSFGGVGVWWVFELSV